MKIKFKSEKMFAHLKIHFKHVSCGVTLTIGGGAPFRTTLRRAIHLAHTARRFKCTTRYKSLRTYCPNRFTVPKMQQKILQLTYSLSKISKIVLEYTLKCSQLTTKGWIQATMLHSKYYYLIVKQFKTCILFIS